MRIGLVCPYNLTKGGGVQECVCALRAGLAARGHHVVIVTPLPKDNHVEEEPGIIYMGRARDIKSPFATVGQISVSLNPRTVEDILEKEQFDILHFHEPWVPIVSRQLLTRSDAKNVATFHAKLPDTMMSKTIERVITPYTKSIMKYLDGLTAVSEAAADYVTTLTDRPIEIIPNGINLSDFKEASSGSQPNSRSILYIGRLERRKGVKFLIQAFAWLQEQIPDARLDIAGDGPDRAKLELLSENLGVASKVTFHGFVDEEKKRKLLSEAGVFCSPALFGESFGIVLLEALAQGLPIVAGNNPGYVGVMKELGALSIVNPKDGVEFARRLELLLLNEDLRALWKSWAREYVKQYDYEKIVAAYENYYRKILEGSL